MDRRKSTTVDTHGTPMGHTMDTYFVKTDSFFTGMTVSGSESGSHHALAEGLERCEHELAQITVTKKTYETKRRM